MTEKSLSSQLESAIKDAIYSNDDNEFAIFQIDEETIQIGEQIYKLVANHRDGFDREVFSNLYDPLFEKHDFIVGDWGHEKLRLRGFYQLGRHRTPREQQIDFLNDYLNEYCNFGCAYFVLAKSEAIDKYQQLQEKRLHKIQNQNATPSKPHSKKQINTKPHSKKQKNWSAKSKQTANHEFIQKKSNQNNHKKSQLQSQQHKNFVIKKKGQGK